MPRIARKSIETPFLHVMVQGVNKEYIFNNDEYIKMYLELIEKNKVEYDVTILAYCVMNNHAHFLMYIEDKEKFGKFMHQINFKYAKMYNKIEKRCGVLFRNRYQSEQICDRKYLINCIKYIHENPVKAGIVRDAGDFKYSSYNNYINNVGECQSPIMKEIFGENCDYQKIFKKVQDMRFMDNEKKRDDLEYYMKAAINEFVVINKVDLVDIFADRKILKLMIRDLKKKYNYSYAEICEFFEITKSRLESLKKI